MFKNGKYEEAVKYAEKAVAIEDSSSSYYYILGEAYGLLAQNSGLLGKLSNAKKCRDAWLKAVELDPENLDARYGLFDYYLQAPPIAGGGKEKAKKEAEQIIKIDPVGGHLSLAQLYESEKNYTEAEKEFIEAAEIDPQNTNVYLNLGYFYQRVKEYDKAREAFLKVLDIDDDNMAACYQLGRTAIFSGKYLEEAIGYFKKYLENKPSQNDPSWSYAHWRLGMVYEKLNNREKAIEEYKKAIELDPENKDAKKALERITR